MNNKAWMVRAGHGGVYSKAFEKGFTAIGWGTLGDLNQYKSVDALRAKYIETSGNEKPARTANAVAMILKFRDQIQSGDYLSAYILACGIIYCLRAKWCVAGVGECRVWLSPGFRFETVKVFRFATCTKCNQSSDLYGAL